MSQNAIGGFLVGMAMGVFLVVVLMATCERLPTDVEAKWCVEMFAAPQADTLAILREHDFCRFPRATP